MSDFNSYKAGVDLSVLRDECFAHGTIVHFNKGEHFARRGRMLSCWGIVVSGSFKYVMTDSEGNLHIVGFVFDDDIVGDFLSLVGQRPVIADIISVTDADVMVCDVSVVANMFAAAPELRIALADGLFRQAYDLYLELHLKSPKERYEALLRRFPKILQYISLREMSSYLCITPTHLSRIRHELTFGGKEMKNLSGVKELRS